MLLLKMKSKDVKTEASVSQTLSIEITLAVVRPASLVHFVKKVKS